MINELYQLSKALRDAGIEPQCWHRKYVPIPNIRSNAPCVCVRLSDGKVIGLDSICTEQGQYLRKYGSNQGTYPCMNLAPLYRITDESQKKKLSDYEKYPEMIDRERTSEMLSWCTEDNNNWGSKFRGKYRISMESIPSELSSIQYEPLIRLIAETDRFKEASRLHKELEAAAWELLTKGGKTSLALKILFYSGRPDKEAKDDYGTLSVAFDSAELLKSGISAVSEDFVWHFNQKLREADADQCTEQNTDCIEDAFGIGFRPVEEPLPKVKLSGGFDVTLRTMFKEQLCQTRYGRIENASYPISPEIRKALKAALEWAGSPEQKDTTWINTDKNEILFVYPSSFTDRPKSFTDAFGPSTGDGTEFVSKAKRFVDELKKAKEHDTDSEADRITIFILKRSTKPAPRSSTPARPTRLSWKNAAKNGSGAARISRSFRLAHRRLRFPWRLPTF